MTVCSTVAEALARSVRDAAADNEEIRVTVHGDCMDDIDVGDVVRVDTTTYEVSLPVLYYTDDPWGLYVHRLLETDEEEGTMRTKGDQLDEADPAMPVEPYLLGKVVEPSVDQPDDDRDLSPDLSLRNHDGVHAYPLADGGLVGLHSTTGDTFRLDESTTELYRRLRGATVEDVAESTDRSETTVVEFARSAYERRLLVHDTD
jgi:hypothetical protein